jgi:hypothetical protein
MRATAAPGSLQAPAKKPSVSIGVARMSEATSGERLPRISLRSCGLLVLHAQLSRWSVRLRSRGMMRPGLVNHSPQKKRGTQRDPQTRARETPGARCTRSPCATGSKHTVVTTGSPKTPGVSCAMVLTAYGALFPATNSSCHRHRRIKVHRSPVGLVHLRRFSTSNGCRNHTLLPSAATSTDPRVGHVLPTAFQSRR